MLVGYNLSRVNQYSFWGSVYRVNWLRAKCRRDRWAEELTLVRSEMEWTRLFHTHRIKLWESRAIVAASDSPSLQYYAHRQAWTWTLLRTQAENALKDSSSSSVKVAK